MSFAGYDFSAKILCVDKCKYYWAKTRELSTAEDLSTAEGGLKISAFRFAELQSFLRLKEQSECKILINNFRIVLGMIPYYMHGISLK